MSSVSMLIDTSVYTVTVLPGRLQSSICLPMWPNVGWHYRANAAPALWRPLYNYQCVRKVIGTNNSLLSQQQSPSSIAPITILL